jgi:hypothetical protein
VIWHFVEEGWATDVLDSVQLDVATAAIITNLTANGRAATRIR